MNDRPTCGKCGLEMTRENARIRPELFLHDECLPDDLRPKQPGPKKPKSMLYEVCDMCSGTGRLCNPHNTAEDIPCVCKPLRVVETGVTAKQLERLAELDVKRQEAGISAEMLRDGRARKAMDAAKEWESIGQAIPCPYQIEQKSREQAEINILTAALHKGKAHPAYSYIVIPSGQSVGAMSVDWERNPECVLQGGDVCWRRRKEPS